MTTEIPLARVYPDRRLWIAILILCTLPVCSCGRYRARNELNRSHYFAEIVKRVDRRSVGNDRFFEENLLANPDPEVRQWCALALGRIASPGTLPLLYQAAQSGDAAIRAASVFAIGQIEDRDLLKEQNLAPDPKSVAKLISLLDDPSVSVRMRVVEALGKIGSGPESGEIIRRLESVRLDGSSAEREYIGFAITALVRLKDRAALPIMERLADSKDAEIQWRAVDALVRLHHPNALSLFARKLGSSNSQVVCQAVQGLANQHSGAERVLLPLLNANDSRTGEPIPLAVRYSTIRSLGELKNPAAIQAIKAALDADPIDEFHPSQQNFAILAAASIGDIGSTEGERVLVPLLHSVPPVENSAVIALAKILRGNPERFFALVERSRFTTPAGLSAWVQAMAELGGAEAVEELHRMLAQLISDPTRTDAELFSSIVNALVKLDPAHLQEILLPFFESRDTALLRTAISAYQPKANALEPWRPVAQAFEKCAASSDSRSKIDILLHLAPWIREPKVQQVVWMGLKDPDRKVRLASIALLRDSGISGVVNDPGPATPSVTDAVSRSLAASRKNSTIAVVDTTRGTLEIELFREDAPLTVADFVLRANRGDYNGFVFERVIPAQRIGGKEIESQAGFGRASGGEVNMHPLERGSVGLSVGAGSPSEDRFFIALAPQPYRDGIDTCFGHVISGLQAADRIVPGDRILHVHIKETLGFFDRVPY